LDLEMRQATAGEVGVLDLLHHLVEEYVEQDRGFPEGGMVEIINAVAGEDLSSYYELYIDGPEKPDLAEYLGVIGYQLESGVVSEVSEPTEEQLRARADFFSLSGTPVE
jgi:predicted metalloprotease with PDZ domain